MVGLVEIHSCEADEALLRGVRVRGMATYMNTQSLLHSSRVAGRTTLLYPDLCLRSLTASACSLVPLCAGLLFQSLYSTVYQHVWPNAICIRKRVN